MAIVQEKPEEPEDFVLSASEIQRFLVKRENNAYVVHGIVTVDQRLKLADIEQLDIQIKQRQGNHLSVIIPVKSLKPLGQVRGVQFIEIDTPVIQRKSPM